MFVPNHFHQKEDGEKEEARLINKFWQEHCCLQDKKYSDMLELYSTAKLLSLQEYYLNRICKSLGIGLAWQ